MQSYGLQSQQNGRRVPPHFMNPNQVSSYIYQAVDFTMISGQRVCNAFIIYVSPEVDPQNSTYGDFTYLIYNGGFVMISNNAANISQIGPRGSICR